MKFAIVLLAVFGFSCAAPASRSLTSDLDDFLALIPTDDFVALYHKYENDADIKKVVAYLKSNDFEKVMEIIKNVDEVRDLVDWIEGQGVPVVDFLNKLADLLGLPHWGRYTTYIHGNSRSWRSFLDEAKELIDLDAVLALAIDKLANSPDFQALFERIANVDYQKLHDAALTHPEIVDMIDRLTEMGVDVMKVWDFVKSIFGWNYYTVHKFRVARTSRSLASDLDELMALIPTEDFVALYHKYENDEDVKKIVAYLKSSDFKDVMEIIKNVPEVRDVVDWIEGKGVPIIDFLNKLADHLGLPHWRMYTRYTRKSTRSWIDFIEEARQLIDTDKIIALVFDKLANSPDFQALYEKIASVDYQRLHDAALSHPEIVDMIVRLKAMGFDVEAGWEFVKSIFGWE